jgi:hypothetical protein
LRPRRATDAEQVEHIEVKHLRNLLHLAEVDDIERLVRVELEVEILVPGEAGATGFVVLGQPEPKSRVPNGLVDAHAHSSEHSRAVNISRVFQFST